jgi:hypothetical protein
MQMSDQLHALAALAQRKKIFSAYCVGGWMGPRVRLDAVTRRRSIACIRNQTLCTSHHLTQTGYGSQPFYFTKITVGYFAGGCN